MVRSSALGAVFSMQDAICKYNEHKGGPTMSDWVDIHAGLGRPRSSTTNDLSDHAAVDISVVMPCLNEEGSVGLCVSKAWEGIRRTGLRGEGIVASTGSPDNSRAVAEAAGARVVHHPRRGYGNAYIKGFSAARGRIIVMGDSRSEDGRVAS